MSGFLESIDISAKGLTVQRSKLNVIAKNMANVSTTETEEGGPYRRQTLEVSADEGPRSFRSALRSAGGNLNRTHGKHIPSKGAAQFGQTSGAANVEAEVVESDKEDFKLIYDPSHPSADEEGYVKMPNIEIITEMVDMMAASRAYEANTVAIAAAKSIAKDSLEI